MTPDFPSLSDISDRIWCECRHPDHFDSGKDEHTYGAHIRANVTMARGARFCAKCAAYHSETASPTPSNDTPLGELLAAHEDAIFADRDVEFWRHAAIRSRTSKTRQAIESAFSKLETENERLRGECSGWQDIAEHAERNALTPEEAAQILDSQPMISSATRAKLRSLSSPETQK